MGALTEWFDISRAEKEKNLLLALFYQRWFLKLVVVQKFENVLAKIISPTVYNTRNCLIDKMVATVFKSHMIARDHV